jgi:hypothetical protein
VRKVWRRQTRGGGDVLDNPVHHRVAVVVVVDGDAGAPPTVLAVGAEEAVRFVLQEKPVFPAGPNLDGNPGNGVVVVVDALDDVVADMSARRRVVGGLEVAAEGGAVEEDVGGFAADDAVHLPRRVERLAERAQEHGHPVLVGDEVHAVAANVPQPHLVPVGEALQRSPRGAEALEAAIERAGYSLALHRRALAGAATAGWGWWQRRPASDSIAWPCGLRADVGGSGAEQEFVAGCRERGAKFQGGASRLRGVPPRRQLGPACGPGCGGIQSALQQLRFRLGRFHAEEKCNGATCQPEVKSWLPKSKGVRLFQWFFHDFVFLRMRSADDDL